MAGVICIVALATYDCFVYERIGGIINIMSNKKKRNKKYHGSVAASRPTIFKVSAVKRNPVHQWWLDHKRVAKPGLIAGGIGIVLIITLIGIIDLIW